MEQSLKRLLKLTKKRLEEAKVKAKEIMEASGVTGPFVDGMIHGGHLGGTVPLTKRRCRNNASFLASQEPLGC